MNDCASAWTPGNTFGFVFALIFLLGFTGVLDIFEAWARKR